MLMKRAAYQRINKLNISVEARAKSAMAGHDLTQRKDSNSNGRQYKSNRSSNLSQKSKNSKK